MDGRRLSHEIERDALQLRLAGSEDLTIPLAKVVGVYRPNEMGTFDKLGH